MVKERLYTTLRELQHNGACWHGWNRLLALMEKRADTSNECDSVYETPIDKRILDVSICLNELFGKIPTEDVVWCIGATQDTHRTRTFRSKVLEGLIGNDHWMDEHLEEAVRILQSGNGELRARDALMLAIGQSNCNTPTILLNIRRAIKYALNHPHNLYALCHYANAFGLAREEFSL